MIDLASLEKAVTVTFRPSPSRCWYEDWDVTGEGVVLGEDGQLLYFTPQTAARHQALAEARAWVEQAKSTWMLLAYSEDSFGAESLWLAPEGLLYRLAQRPGDSKPRIRRIDTIAAWYIYDGAQTKAAPFPDWALPPGVRRQ